MNVEILWVVGRYAFLGLLYLFVALVVRALINEMRAEPLPTPEGHAERWPGALSDPEVTTSRDALLVESATDAPLSPREAPAPGGTVGGSSVVPLPPRLVVVESSDPVQLPLGKAFPLTAVTTIGRGMHNTVSLPTDEFASNNHALIFMREGVPTVRDRGSTNGTVVNGERLTEERPIVDGDRVAVGMTVLRLSAGRSTYAPAASRNDGGPPAGGPTRSQEA